MTKFIFFVLIFLGSALLSITAQKRSEAQIQEFARHHFNAVGTRRVSSLTTIPASRILPSSATRSAVGIGEPFYLVVSPGYMVIISGDERMKPVLGYSDRANFNLSQLSPDFLGWLTIYADEYEYLQKHSSGDLKWRANESSVRASMRSAEEPLLGSIAWKQDNPFNQKCPLDNGSRSATGCVATAMAQVMMYHQYPERGKGVKNYYSSGINQYLSLDLASEPLEWSKMQVLNTTESQNAVAWLMYCCGVAVETNYSKSDSDAGSSKIVTALVEHFAYDKGVRFDERAHYNAHDWIELIKADINEKRPVICAAYSANVPGHCFVLDGYDKDDKVHVNWGWGGGSNGYYEITSMNPYASNGSVGGFNVGQVIVTRIQKPQQGSHSYTSYLVAVDAGIQLNTESISRGGAFSIKESYYANRGVDFDGSLQPALFQNGKLVTLLGASYNAKIAQMGSLKISFDGITVPASVVSGDYDLYIVSKDKQEQDWQIVKMDQDKSPYYQVKVSNTGIIFKNPVNLTGLAVVSFKQEHELYNGLGARCSLILRNDGTEWTGRVGVRLIPVENPQLKEVVLIEERTVFPQGESHFDLYNEVFDAMPGKYRLVVSYSYYGTDWFPVKVDQEYVVTVYPKPEPGSYQLQLDKMAMRHTQTEKDRFSVTATISNVGSGPFDGNIKVLINRELGGSFSKEKIYEIFVDANQKKEFSFSLDEPLPDGDYLVTFSYWSGLVKPRNLSKEGNDFVVRTLFGGSK